MLPKEQEMLDYIEYDKNCYSINRVYDKKDRTSVVQVLNSRKQIQKCLFYDDSNRLSNVCIYNPDTGKEIKNISYRSDGKTISSIREYDTITEKLYRVSFYKEDGINISSLIRYDENGRESECTLYCDNGEVIQMCL